MPNFHNQRVFGRVVKISFTAFIILVNAVLLWRVFFSANIPNGLRALDVNEHSLAAYEQYGEDITLRYQNTYSTTYGEGNVGYFSTAECTFLPQANQVQVVVRYNNSTLRSLARDYEMDEIPKKALEWFDFTLVRATDRTPEDPTDNNKPDALTFERIAPTSSGREETALYTYYRLVFDNVTVAPDTDGIFLDVYYLGDLNYDQTAYGTLCLYDCRKEWMTRTLTRADRKAFDNAQAAN